MNPEFTEYVKNHIREYLPDSYANAEIQIQQTIKSNDRILESLMIRREGEDAAPMIHLDNFKMGNP